MDDKETTDLDPNYWAEKTDDIIVSIEELIRVQETAKEYRLSLDYEETLTKDLS